MHFLTSDLFWLVLTIAMTSIFWMPYIINRMLEQGIFNALWDPLGVTETKIAWADRMMKAHENAVENLVIFAPLVILVYILEINSAITLIACIIYFFARLIHFLVFTFAIPLLRVVSFLVGFGAQASLLIVIIIEVTKVVS